MDDNEALNSPAVEPGEQQRRGLWFLNENGDEQAFQLEGFVRRIPGEEDRVQFTGSCVLKDAPHRKLSVEGKATVAVVKKLQSGAGVEQQVDTAASQAPTAWELANADVETPLLSDERIAQLDEAIDRGHVVVKRGSGIGSVTISSDEEKPAVERASSDQNEEADQKGDRPKETASFEIDDTMAPPLDEKVEQRLNEAIDRGQIVLRQRRDEQATTGSSKARRDSTEEDEGDEEDQPSLVSPVRRLRQLWIDLANQREEGQDDPSVFTPLRPVRWVSDEEDGRDSPEMVSPVRRLRFGLLEDESDGPSFFTPIPPPRPSWMVAREASPIDDQPGPSRIHIDVEEAYAPSESESTSPSTSPGVGVDEGSWGGESENGGVDKPAFPIEMVRDQLIDGSYGGFEASERAAVYASAVVEMLTKRVLTLAGMGTDVINRDDVRGAMFMQDHELHELLKNVIFMEDPFPEP